VEQDQEWRDYRGKVPNETLQRRLYGRSSGHYTYPEHFGAGGTHYGRLPSGAPIWQGDIAPPRKKVENPYYSGGNEFAESNTALALASRHRRFAWYPGLPFPNPRTFE
jgi:hypothetical protein